MTEPSKKGRGWEVGIWLFYAGFVVFILACVGFASMQRFDLVEDDYYERGIGYQSNIDQNARTASLAEKPMIALDQNNDIQITFPASLREGVSGQILLYRPSDAQHDRQISVQLDELGAMVLPMAERPTGLWKVKLTWQFNGQAYYTEETIIVE